MVERFIIIGQEKSQCGSCFDFFHPTTEYHAACAQRSLNGLFPADFPNLARKNPAAYCSANCEQIAIDEARLSRIEFERLLLETA